MKRILEFKFKAFHRTSEPTENTDLDYRHQITITSMSSSDVLAFLNEFPEEDLLPLLLWLAGKTTSLERSRWLLKIFFYQKEN